ncbi:hypothetical protein FRC17_010180 [Serendipita sp. 399]|nr:hypothetical protein FRC17_010180 [Serendipita sp. 399]
MENDEEEEEIECLICSGIGSEENDPMAQSISSLASTTLESVNGNGSRNEQFFHRTESFGPLEEFCINAPHKHLAHRECFLQWVEAYRQQHQRIFLEPVTVVYEDPTEMERIGKRRATQQKAWIKSILQAAGFEHILSSLIYPPPPSQQQTLSRGQTSITVRPTPRAPSQSRSLLMIMNASSSSPSSSSSSSTPFAASNNNTLAALQTSSPSCPACRGPVSILFTQEPLHPQSRAGPSLASPQALAQRLARLRKFIKLFMRGWRREFLASVTGRSLLWRLVAQYSFLFVLVSMIRATRKGKRILV